MAVIVALSTWLIFGLFAAHWALWRLSRDFPKQSLTRGDLAFAMLLLAAGPIGLAATAVAMALTGAVDLDRKPRPVAWLNRFYKS